MNRLAFGLCVSLLINAQGAVLEDRSSPAFLLRLSLDQSVAQITGEFGPPQRSMSAGVYRILQYGEFNDGDFSWQFSFDNRTGRLDIISRQFEKAQQFDTLFPSGKTQRSSESGVSARVRRLGPDRFLVAIGDQQLFLIRTGALERFYPWIHPDQRS